MTRTLATGTPRVAAALERLQMRTPRALAARERGEQLLASEVVPTFSMPTPVYIESGEGAYLTDIDGNRYLDLAMGFGAQILGHRPERVERAMREQIGRGWHTVLPNTLQHELTELLNEAAPCAELTILANSGTEATMYGMRVARAFTGKKRVGIFGGAYHGTHDYALTQDDPKSPQAAPFANTIGRGVPDVVRDETVTILPYLSDAAFEIIQRYKDELACIIIQPVQNTIPRLDVGEFLADLRLVCDECDVLLMFDEVITGFRMAYAGGQGYFGVTPDLASFGKIIGGGTPVGAVCGRADIMSMFSKAGSRGVFSGGTFSGNPLTMAAGTATLRYLKEREGTLYPSLEARSNRLADAVNGYCYENEMDVTLLSAGSIQCFHFVKGEVGTLRQAFPPNRKAEGAFYLHVLDRGVLVPGVHVYFVSDAHTDDHIDQIIGVFIEALDECRADELL